jgi:FixJ family two-component response regulator
MKGTKQHVFVVDGNVEERGRTAELLKREKYAVASFANATEYLESEPPNGPTCLVVEAHLPGGSGLELLQSLTEAGRCEPIVFTTSDPGVTTGIRAMKAGAVDYLLRPFEERTLMAAVERGLARSEAESRERAEIRDAQARVAALTEKQERVLRMVLAGCLNKQIADRLPAALRTVKRHRADMMRTMGAHSVVDLIRLGQKAGLDI